ncbi:MAG TPA: BLF1 family deaminating toxin [Thermoanaerobaculia bacterium]
MTLLHEFRTDPVEFAKKYPLTMPGPGRNIEFKEKQFRNGEDDVTGYQVAGSDRIFWFDIDRVRGDQTLVEIQLQSAEDRELETAYWLPWAENQIIRTALRPSQKASGALRGVDPDYFFTAPLTGCSVFVEGTRDQPTVYHANAKSHAGTFATSLTKRQFVELQQAKVAEMERRYGAFSTQQEKPSRGHVRPGPSGRESTMLDYMSRAHSSNFGNELEEVVSKATNGRFTKIEIAGQKIVVTNAEGTVFGVRRRGEWTFYFQKRVRIQHLVNDYQATVGKQGWFRYAASFINPFDYYSWYNQSWRVQGEMWLPLTVSEFWPAGGGQVVMRNL